MTAIESKTYLVNRILEINDETFLKAIKNILDSKSQSETLILTKEKWTELAESKKQIEQGLFLDQEEMDFAFDKWQNEKQSGLTRLKSNFLEFWIFTKTETKAPVIHKNFMPNLGINFL